MGGPVGKPGGNNKLFFFYSHEFRPTNAAINGGNPIRLRVPTALERAGDFSQTLDNNGNPFNHDSGLHDGAERRRRRRPGQNPGEPAVSDRYRLLGRYPMPNIEQAAGHELQLPGGCAAVENLTQQPAIRLDYQLSSKLRFTGNTPVSVRAG